MTADRLMPPLEQAAAWFQEYADSHRAKGAHDKANRNQQRADYCRRAAAPASPTDSVLVPREPTEAMLAAPKEREWAWRDEEPVTEYDLQNIYRAMLAAAPATPRATEADLLRLAVPIIEAFAHHNPRHNWAGGEWQDPCGVHAWLAAYRAALAAPATDEAELLRLHKECVRLINYPNYEAAEAAFRAALAGSR